MRILRPQPILPEHPPAPGLSRTGAGAVALGCRVRLPDGRVFTGDLTPTRHRAIQLGLLHAETGDLVELTPGVRPPGGPLALDRRRRPEHYLPGGASGRISWLEALLAHAERIVTGAYATRTFPDGPREEAFVGVTGRIRPRGNKDAVAFTRFLWVDVDRPGRLPALWAFLAERPCHLLIESAGSGGVHAYWKLAEPLEATRLEPPLGELAEPIEAANSRIIFALGSGPDRRPDVADPQCRERARVMRLAGTVNYKTGAYARVLEADFALRGYPLETLVGDLPDPPQPAIAAAPGPTRRAPRSVQADPAARVLPATGRDHRPA